MNTKNNQRYREMDICMKAALLELMKEIPFEKITVKGICERAGVNRGTFYSHYNDIYDMIEDAENYLNNELINITKEWEDESSLIKHYLLHIKEHSYFYRISLLNRKRLVVRKTFRPLWEKIVKPRDEKNLLYYYIAFESCISGVLQYWIETGCKESEDTISTIIQDCIPKISLVHRIINN